MKLLLLLLLAAAFFYPIWVVHRETLGHHEKVEKSPGEWGVECRDIEYITSDGLTLRGWWIPAESEKAVLLLHGNGGSRNGYTSGIFELGRWYREQGFNVMMVDMRSHGESEGDRIGFGIKESEDLLGWVSRIDPESSFAWTIHGFSMGAVTALMMKEREPERFAKVVADAPWIDFHLLAKQELLRRAHLPPLFYGYVKIVARMVLGLDFDAADNRQRCKRLCGEKILYLFEREDRLVTPRHVGILREICPEADIVEFEGVGHVEAYLTFSERYTNLLKEFLSSP